MTRDALLPVLVFVLIGTGCVAGGGDDEMVTCDFNGPAWALGGGGTQQTGFVNLSDGAEMTVTLGPQGLNMVTPSIRVQNMYPGKAGRTGNPNDPTVLVELFINGQAVGGSARENLGLRVSADGADALGIFAPFTIDLDEYLGKMVTVRGTVEDACGRSASDELEILAIQ